MAQQHGENLKQAMDTLRAHKLRSFLTVLGVVLGVSVIMLVAALITGFDQQVQESIKQYGADTAFVSRFDQGPHGGRRPKEERERKPLTLEDAQAVKELCPAIKDLTVFITWWEQPHTVRTRSGEVTAIDFRGVEPNFGQVYGRQASRRWHKPARNSAKARPSISLAWGRNSGRVLPTPRRLTAVSSSQATD